ncbi:MAG: alpha/beta hydrolase domain-containing protein [Alcaligenaceae bacterium]
MKNSLAKIATATALSTLVSFNAAAEITRLEITSTQPYGTFRAGDYTIIQATLHGQLSPTEQIPGLDKAPLNALGKVDYSTKLVLTMPTDKSRGNGALLVDVPNRGKAYANALYNSPRDEPFQSGTFEQGTGFLQDNGFSIAEVYWELGQGANLPSFVDAEGKRKYVEGAGFAMMRDAGVFLAHAAKDSAGNANPLAGMISRTLASGKSQTGRFLKTFLLSGFNMAGPQRVFDGMHVFVSGSGLLPIMQTGTGPESSANGTPSFTNPEMPGVHDGLLTIGEITTQVVARGEVPPKMILITTSTDYYSLRASLGRTGAEGQADQTLPENVRMYDIAGSSHVLIPLKPAYCTLSQGVLDWTPVSRATFLRLDQWVGSNVAPPATQLMTLERASALPATLKAPNNLPNAVMQVPKLDADGNALGGVRLPDLIAPLGTHGGQNSPETRCSLMGSYIPFAKDAAQRTENNDLRPSVAERYKNRDDYVNRIRSAALNLLESGFLLRDDAAIIVQAAATTRAFGELKPNPNAR